MITYKKIFSTFIFALFLTPIISFAQYSGGNDELAKFGTKISDFINSTLVPFVFAVALLLFIYGVYLYFFHSQGDADQQKTGKNYILWAIGAFVVMISIWGIVNLIAGGFGLDDDDLNRSDLPKASETRDGISGGAGAG